MGGAIDVIRARAETIKKYGVTTIVIASIPFTLPYVDKYLDKRQAIAVKRAVKQIAVEEREVIFAYVDNKTKSIKEDLIKYMSKTKLTDELSIEIMKNAIGFQSVHKREWLISFMSDMDVELKRNEEYAKKAIKAELIRQTNLYVAFLNNFVHPKLGFLGDYVAKNFPMDNFLKEIYRIVLDENIGNIRYRADIIMSIMLTMQNDLLENARKDMQ
jgi:hypothetical protein